MEFNNLFLSFLLASASVVCYKGHKEWQKMMERKKEGFFQPSVKLSAFKQWIIIIGFASASIVYLIKGI